MDEWSEAHVGARDRDGCDPDLIDVLFIVGKPIEKQQKGIHLVIIPATRKGEEFALKFRKPWSILRQQNAAGFKSPLVATHSRFFVRLRVPPLATRPVTWSG